MRRAQRSNRLVIYTRVDPATADAIDARGRELSASRGTAHTRCDVVRLALRDYLAQPRRAQQEGR